MVIVSAITAIIRAFHKKKKQLETIHCMYQHFKFCEMA